MDRGSSNQLVMQAVRYNTEKTNILEKDQHMNPKLSALKLLIVQSGLTLYMSSAP